MLTNCHKPGKKFRIIIPVILFFFTCISSPAQKITGTVYGEVLDLQSQIPLPGANVLIHSKDTVLGAITDNSGHFRLEGIPVGRFDIQVSFIGYNSVIHSNIQLNSTKQIYMKIELQEDIEKIDEVVVRAYGKDRPLNEFATLSARSFTIEETNKYAGSWGDPARMVSGYAGVASAGDQRNDIIIRGNAPIGLLWRLDGMVIPNPNHFGAFGTTGGPISILNNNQLTNSDFFTGAFPAEYGNALSGAFDLKMRKGNTEDYEFMGQMGFNGFELGAEGPISKKRGSSFMVNYRYTMMDLMHALGMFDVGGIPLFTDLSFKVHLPTEKMGTFSVIGLGGISEVRLREDKGSGWTADMPAGTQVYYGSSLGVFGINHKLFLSERTRIESSLSVSHSNSFNDCDTVTREDIYTNFYYENYGESRYTFSTKIAMKINPKHTFQTGGSVDFHLFDFYDEVLISSLDEIINLTDMNDQTVLYQVFAQMKSLITDALHFNYGLHGQLLGLNGSGIIEPRLGVVYALNPKHSFRLGYGLHGQMQPMLVYFTQTLTDTPGDTYILTNESLGFTISHHFIAAYDFRITRNLRLKMEAYLQSIKDVAVESSPSFYSLTNYGADFYNEKTDSLVNEGLGENKGVELTLEKFLSKNFYFLLTGSLYESRYRASDDQWRSSAFNGNYIVNGLAGYEIPLKNNVLAFNAKVVWAGGKRYIPIDLDESIRKGETVYSYEEAYTNRYPDFFRVDTRISFRQNLKKISQEWSFDVQNLTDHKNIFLQKYDSASEEIIDVLQMGLFMIGSWKIYF